MMLLHGTIGILYQGSKYNIPIEMFVPSNYPISPPQVFVRPTPNMMVLQGHPYVDSNGFVMVPYMRGWNNSCNLRELTNSLVSLFSAQPPLFTKPKTSEPMQHAVQIHAAYRYKDRQTIHTTTRFTSRLFLTQPTEGDCLGNDCVPGNSVQCHWPTSAAHVLLCLCIVCVFL